MIDVLIAGGGPAGLATAIRCAQAGLEVTVAEPRTGPIDKACGEGLMPAAVAGLDAIGVDPGGWPLRGIRYLDERHRADGLFRGGAGLGVRRTELHAALGLRARELGVSVVPVRVGAFVQEGGCVRAAGLTARYLVAADGLHSSIRRACGLEGSGGSFGGSLRSGPLGSGPLGSGSLRSGPLGSGSLRSGPLGSGAGR
ncbi:MAG TPA: FAD-dependent monooxygenase, partial [Streptosporangiaceae bacterium]|nr:FAD-dependent monooxygenase [Streptosporangiaceae bacterium]